MPSASRAKSTKDTATDRNMEAETSGEIMPFVGYNDDDLRNLDSFEAALELAGAAAGSLDDASNVLGDGFRLLDSADDKMNLVGKPTVFLEWRFNESAEYGGEFVSIRMVVQEPNGSVSKYIVNDGSTGVCKTLRQYADRTGRNAGLVVRKGFRESTYPFCNDCGAAVKADHATEHPDHKVGRARTFYIDTSA